ncbi:hypothetical protein GBA63_01745 [Rubrobacter tropicus]|uniref:NlpC/P60 domain-containing protein n=1 Tax=Rubrobacter tropicus TaxID=2653851 RepID=A0A6G8Q4W0_9ACTN|nr:NlpC/P60 family protein [Rubrobacter tropicus]QIN81490.1 hypothetical protein GBA63_01745 [Rubrobacter tropicus]
MRRISLVGVTMFVASIMAVFLSLLVVAEAKSEPGPPTARALEELEGVEDRVLNESPKNPYHQVVDNSSSNFEAKGYQSKQVAGSAFGKGYAVATEKAGPVSFKMKVPRTRYYSVWARWPAGGENAQAARLGIPAAGGTKWEEVDQSKDGGMWVRIGAYKMQKGQRDIRLESGGGRAVADAVMIVGDALVGKDGRTASVADPYTFAADEEDRSSYDSSGSLSKSSTTTKAGQPTGADVLRVAKRHLGTPYGHNRCRNDVQEDCSCHTKLVFKRFGQSLPDSPVYQWNMDRGYKIYGKTRLRAGDVVFHDLDRDGRLRSHFADHVSIWAGRGNIIHASTYFGRVVVSEERYLGGYWGAKRFALR